MTATLDRLRAAADAQLRADGRGRWPRNPGDLPPALRAALDRCPTCGAQWPDVPAQQLTPCRPA